MSKFVRASLWAGSVLTALLVVLRLIAPELLRNDLVWFVLMLGAGLSFSFAAAETCGLNLSSRSLDRLPAIFAAFGIVLVLDTSLRTGHFSKLWHDPMAIPLSVVWFGGVIAYHLFKYRRRARADGP